MIKDKIIQKKIKGKVLAVAMTAVMASLFVPMVGNAAEEDVSKVPWTAAPTIDAASLNAGDIIIPENCSGGKACQGHKIEINQGSTSVKGSIRVQKGHHYIKLSGADFTSEQSIIQIEDGANVTLVVEGTNSLAGGAGGIYVAQNGKLSIQKADGSTDDTSILKVQSTGDGAGIGGSGIGDNSSTGEIKIESGTIIAQGGNRGAGIGGSAFGTAKSITINGGIVIAKGGDGVAGEYEGSSKVNGAPGIGSGNDVIKGDNDSVVINGGKITAIGGMHHDNDKVFHAAGIVTDKLTSKNGGATVLVSDRIDVTSDDFSGLVWNLKRNEADGKLMAKDDKTEIDDSNFMSEILSGGAVNIKHGGTCTVHNDAEIPPGFETDFNTPAEPLTPPGKNILEIPTGTSLRIPSTKFQLGGIILAGKDSTLINPNDIVYLSGSDFIGYKDMNYKVSFSPDRDLVMKNDTNKGYEPFVYKGEAYKKDTLPENEIFRVATSQTVKIQGQDILCPVDRVGLKATFEWLDIDRNADYSIENDGVKDAGNYKVTFEYGTITHPIEFRVEPLDINSNAISVSPIPNKEYKGAEFVPGDFDNTEVILTYNGVPLKTTDYSLDLNGQINAGDAEMTIRGKNNFSGNRKASFKIIPLTMNEENTVVELNGGNIWETTYDGLPHQPDIKSVSIDLDGSGTLMPVDDWKKEIVGDTTNAGVVTIVINSKSKNFTGECKKQYIIRPRQLVVKSITPERTERKYDGTATIKIKDVDVDITQSGDNAFNNTTGILVKDNEEIGLPENVTGTIGDGAGNKLERADVKSDGYSEVILDEDMCLSGAKGMNYTIAGRYNIKDETDNFRLTDSIVITKREAPVIEITGNPVPDEMDAPKFICNLIVTGKDANDVIDPDCDIYTFRCTPEEPEPPAADDLTAWDKGKPGELAYSNISPNSEETFYVMVGGTINVAGTEPQACSVSIPKYPRKDGPPAEECTLTASETPNENGETYKLTVEPAQVINDIYPEGRYLYSLSEEGPYIGGDPSSLFDNVEPKTEYTAYVKYAATDEYTESETGTPTNSVTTNEGKAQKPTVTCNGTTQSEGEIHFSGTASVSLEYAGGLQGYEIRFTKDGTQPTASSELYGAPFEVSEGMTVNAFVIKPGVASSEVTSVKLVRDGDSPSNPSTGTEVELQRLTEETAPALLGATALPTKGIDTFDAVSTPLATPILQQRGYENNNITYADLKIKIKGTDRYATEDDFKNAAGGVIRVTITMDQLKAIGLPAGYDGTTHNFAVTHMFATAGANLGNVETIGTAHNFSKSRDGKSISFDMTSTSPVAFGWADVNNSDPNPVGPGTDDPGNQDPGTDDPGNQDPGTQDPGTQDPNTIVGEGDPRQGAQGTQGNGTTTGTDAGTQGASNDAANALSGIMPKTGDPLSFVPWIAAIVISVGAIAFFATRKRDKKKQTVKKTQAAKKKK